MDQNPYKAPAADGESERQTSFAWRRWLAVTFALPSLLISGFCLCVIFAVIEELIAWPWKTPRPPWSEIVAGLGFYSASALTWGVTAWASWKGRGRAVIAALLADLALVAAAVLID